MIGVSETVEFATSRGWGHRRTMGYITRLSKHSYRWSYFDKSGKKSTYMSAYIAMYIAIKSYGGKLL